MYIQQLCPKLRTLKNLLQHMDRPWKRVIYLARQGERSERDKLDRRPSAKLTVLPSSDARPL